MKAKTSPAPQKAEQKPQKKLLFVVIFLLFAIGFMVYRITGTLSGSRTNPQLRVSDDLVINTPPLPQTGDITALQERLYKVADRSRALATSETIDRGEWLEFAREAGLAGDTLTAYYALQVGNSMTPNPAVYEPLGHIEVQLCLFNNALGTYTAMAQVPDLRLASQLGLSRAYSGLQQNERAMEILHSVEKTLSPTDFAGHMEVAIALEEHGQQAEAIEPMRKAHTIAPENSTITRRLAFVLHNRQQFAEAQSLLEALLGKEKEEEAARTHLLLAKLFRNPLNTHKDLALAESHLLLALQVESQKRDALKSLGELLLEQNRIRPALALYSQLLILAPNDGSLRLKFANAYLRLGDTANGNAQREIAQVLIEQERRAEGLITLRNQKPMEPQTHLALGKCYREQGKTALALASFQTAYALSQGGKKAEEELKNLYESLKVPLPPYKEMISIAIEPLSSRPVKRHIWR